eukprot:scaffold1390_cov138-Cylindrotheca_fusiformis.AAC.38
MEPSDESSNFSSNSNNGNNSNNNNNNNNAGNRWKTQMRHLGSQWKSNVSQFLTEQQQQRQQRSQQQPSLSGQLSSLREHMREEAERRDVRRISEEASLNVMKEHLFTFLMEHPNGTYNQWIEELHPENTQDPQLLQEMDKEVDMRFYVEESDHRKLWNDVVKDPIRQVQARNRVWQEDSHQTTLQNSEPPIDLLSTTTNLQDGQATATTPSNCAEADLIQF